MKPFTLLHLKWGNEYRCINLTLEKSQVCWMLEDFSIERNYHFFTIALDWPPGFERRDITYDGADYRIIWFGPFKIEFGERQHWEFVDDL